MRNERKSISLLGWIIGALLLIYLGVFCYLNLCKYAQHVDSDIAAEALLAREIWVEKDITPNDWISSTERRIIGMPTVAAVFYGITGSMQTAAGITCVLLGAILLGTFYFFLRKLSLSRTASTTPLQICSSRNCLSTRSASILRPSPSPAKIRIWALYWLCCPRNGSSSPTTG